MIAERDLRKLMAAEGYSPEEIEATCAWYSKKQQELAEAAVFAEMLARIAMAVESMQDAFAQLAELGTMPPPPKKEAPRPPRYAGPQNKGRSWTRQPPRLARSSCRKYRR